MYITNKLSNYFKAFIVALSVAVVALFALAPSVSYAAVGDSSKQAACEGVGGCTSNPDKKINDVFKIVINVISVVVGVIAVIMVIISGFRFVTSGGDASKVSSAKSSLMYAVIGIVIVVLSQTIVRLVLDRSVNGVPAVQQPAEGSDASNRN